VFLISRIRTRTREVADLVSVKVVHSGSAGRVYTRRDPRPRPPPPHRRRARPSSRTRCSATGPVRTGKERRWRCSSTSITPSQTPRAGRAAGCLGASARPRAAFPPGPRQPAPPRRSRLERRGRQGCGGRSWCRAGR
jgi:hypothetical protein